MSINSPHLIYGFMIKGSDILEHGQEGDWWLEYLEEHPKNLLVDTDDIAHQKYVETIEQILYENFITNDVYDSVLHDYIRCEFFEDSTFILGYEVTQEMFTIEYIESIERKFYKEVTQAYFNLMGYESRSFPSFYLFNNA